MVRKRVLALILTLTMAVLLLSGCNSAVQEPSPAPETTNAPQESPEIIEAIEIPTVDLDSLDVSDLGCRVTAVELPEDLPRAINMAMSGGKLIITCLVSSHADGTNEYAVYAGEPNGDNMSQLELQWPEDGYLSYIAAGEQEYWAVFTVYPEDDAPVRTLLRKLDQKGGTLAELGLESLFDGQEVTVRTILPRTGGGVFLQTAESLLCLDGDLNLSWQVDGLEKASVMALNAQGVPACFLGGKLCLVKQEGITELDVELSGNVKFYSLCSSSGGYDLLAYNTMNLYGIGTAAEQAVQLLDLEEWGLTNCQILGALSTTEFVAMSNHWLTGDAQLTDLQLVEPSLLPEKKTITVACIGNTSAVLEEVIQGFQAEHQDYAIELATYDSSSQLDMELSSGKYPDVIVQSNGYEGKYVQKGVLAELTALMDQYGGVQQDEFVPSYLESIATETGIYTLSPGYWVYTLVGDEKYVGTQEGWSQDAFAAAISTAPEGMDVSNIGREAFLELSLYGRMQEFADPASGLCSFDSQEFIRLLELCGDLPSLAASMNDSTAPVLSGQVMLQSYDLMDVYSYAEDIYAYPQLTLVGFPGVGGNGSIFNTSEYYGVCALSGDIQGAWDFVSFIFSEEYQSHLPSKLPVTMAGLEAKVQKFVDMFGDDFDDAEAAAQSFIDYICGVSADTKRESTIATIVTEEAAAYFAGDKTAEAVADIVQNRVQTYLNERG